MYTAIIWRKRAPEVDGDRSKTDPWDVRAARISRGQRVSCVVALDLKTGHHLTRGNYGQEQGEINLLSRPKGSSIEFDSGEWSGSNMCRVTWVVIPAMAVPARLEELRKEREELQKKRLWAQMGEVADQIKIIELAKERFQKELHDP